ncbi:hypothetical protein D3C72_302960 [compost metagenome]
MLMILSGRKLELFRHLLLKFQIQLLLWKRELLQMIPLFLNGTEKREVLKNGRKI